MTEFHTHLLDDAGVRQARRSAGRIALVIALLLAAGAGRSLWVRHVQAENLARTANDQTTSWVSVIHATRGADVDALSLPGSLQGETSAQIYGYANGYVAQRFVDIGSQVHRGEDLVLLDTPDLDENLRAVEAAEAQWRSSVALAQASFERAKALHETDSISPQDYDTSRSTYEQAKAELDAAIAATKKAKDLQAFKHVRAPFDGVVTKRYVDIGSMIVTGSGGTLMFELAQSDKLKAVVNVPQSQALHIKNGDEVMLVQSETGQEIPAKVERNARSIDTTTRTMSVEVAVDNSAGNLLPGTFVDVVFKNKLGGQTLSVPTNTLLFRKEGPRVAVVQADEKILLKPVKIGRDFGKQVEILSGVSADDAIVVNPSDSLENGFAVKIVKAASK